MFHNQFDLFFWNLVYNKIMLVFGRYSIEEGSKFTYPIWIMAIISSIAAVGISNTKNVRKGIVLSSLYVIFSVLVSYVGMPNYIIYTAYSKPYVNEVFPEVVFEQENGEVFDLRAIQGKTIVFDFWATFCIPCFKKFPELEKLHKYYETRDTNVLVFAVNLPIPEDSPGYAKKQIGKYNYTFPKLYTKDLDSWKKLKITNVPSLFILDNSQNLRYRGGLFTGWNELMQRTQNVISKIQKNNQHGFY